MGNLLEITREILPYAQSCEPLPEPWASDPDYQAAKALWSVILHPGRNVGARLAALKEYYDRTLGKAILGGLNGAGTEEVNLARLTGAEAAELVRLLTKAKGGDGSDGG